VLSVIYKRWIEILSSPEHFMQERLTQILNDKKLMLGYITIKRIKFQNLWILQGWKQWLG
jgi:hypothetical protein